MKTAAAAPEDLDAAAKKKWLELIGSVDPDADGELLANYCRQHSNLMSVRREKKKQQKAGKFKTMVPGRDGSQVLNPLITAENRMTASLNRMLQTLGLASSREDKAKRLPSDPRPPGARGEEPPWGWAIDAKLCGK